MLLDQCTDNGCLLQFKTSNDHINEKSVKMYPFLQPKWSETFFLFLIYSQFSVMQCISLYHLQAVEEYFVCLFVCLFLFDFWIQRKIHGSQFGCLLRSVVVHLSVPDHEDDVPELYEGDIALTKEQAEILKPSRPTVNKAVDWNQEAQTRGAIANPGPDFGQAELSRFK